MPAFGVRPFKDQPPLYAKDINRLITSIFPSGRILLQDDCAVLRYNKQDIAGVGSVALYNTASSSLYIGSNMINVTTGALANNETHGFRELPYFPFNKLAVEVILIPNGVDVNLDHWGVDLMRWNGVDTCLEAKIFYDGSTLEYWNAAGVQTLAGGTYGFGQNIPITLKFIADFAAGKYAGLYVNELYFPLADTLFAEVSITKKHCQFRVEVKTRNAVAYSLLFGGLIITAE